MTEKCACDNCKIIEHKSSCAVHNQPALPNRECDCKTIITHREIKFRAINSKNEIIYGLPYTDGVNETFYYKEYNNRLCWRDNNGAHCNQPYKNGTLMQYTGLKDKNGKEIYEGDLWKRRLYFDGPRSKTPKKKPFVETISVIAYKNGKFFPDDYKQRYYPYSTTYNNWWENGEVIGNIYEHHHLLEVQHD